MRPPSTQVDIHPSYPQTLGAVRAKRGGKGVPKTCRRCLQETGERILLRTCPHTKAKKPRNE
eukprot:scaffold138950_cov27-Prasinocladus_malaysianus.AAC.1